MSYYLKVLLKLLNILSKIFAVNEFNYDRSQNKMVSSRFWHWYMKILHCIIIWPFNAFFLYLFTDRWLHELNLELILMRLGVYIITMRYITSALMGWYIMYHRRDLCRLLNQFLRLAEMHREIFLRDVHVPWYMLTIHIVHEIYLISSLSFADLGLIMTFMTGQYFFQFYLLDIGLMIYFIMIKKLSKHISNPSPARKAQRSRCIEYFEHLMHLKMQLQQFSWISTTARLSMEIAYVIMLSVVTFWLHFLTGEILSLFYIFRCSLLMSNMMHVVWMARSIEATERQVLNEMFHHEMLIPFKYQKSANRMRLVKLTQIYLKRCTKREQGPSIYNYIYTSRTLGVYIIDFIVSSVFLLVTFSLKYERRNEIFSKHHKFKDAINLKLALSMTK